MIKSFARPGVVPSCTVAAAWSVLILTATVSSLHAAEDRATVFEDDFDNRQSVGEGYTSARGTEDAWNIVDGVLVGKQTKSDHGAVIRKNIKFDDIDLQFDFRFSGGTRFNFVLDDQNEKSVHAGHICRVSISPKKISVTDDKTGNMNLEVRKQRQSKNLPPEQQKSLDTLLAEKTNAAAVNLKPGQWYRLGVRIKGDSLEASLDGKKIVELRSPGIDHPTKTKIGMTVNGSTIDFDNLKVFSVSQ
ncbi:family 16 glycoside hydrolase [Novipirellula caenicola]|uniref:3-keto-alpha-glucoside-1,2-lyase/3-keto-2-hydroxy-glucal hydratase domain-containing protein n=1 Tax=Novipirellula caenicola TaxID=1536901 RepID=A0ABP9VS08_9BACT